MEKLLYNYADLILQRGLAIEKEQPLVIETTVEAIEFLRILTRRAYELGAKDVIVHFSDAELTKTRLQYAGTETLKDVPNWQTEAQTYYGDRDACFLRLISDDPDGLKGVDHEKLAVWKKAVSTPLNDLNFKKKENLLKWSASAVPNKNWAKKVFPDLNEEEAVRKLWDSILKSCYVTEESGLDGWDKHVEELKRNVEKLNSLSLRTLHFKNGKGTDLTIYVTRESLPEASVIVPSLTVLYLPLTFRLKKY